MSRLFFYAWVTLISSWVCAFNNLKRPRRVPERIEQPAEIPKRDASAKAPLVTAHVLKLESDD